jgi:hypothetical protein
MLSRLVALRHIVTKFLVAQFVSAEDVLFGSHKDVAKPISRLLRPRRWPLQLRRASGR